jgi:hypothetical protein
MNSLITIYNLNLLHLINIKVLLNNINKLIIKNNKNILCYIIFLMVYLLISFILMINGFHLHQQILILHNKD